MTESKRRTRPVPGRTEPHRSWAQNLGASRTEPGATGPTEEPAAAGVPPRAQANGEAAYKSVSDAYRLIDDYVRQGQRFAENLWLPFQSAGRNQEAFHASGRMLRAMSDMTNAWLELMQQSVGGIDRGTERAPVGTAGPFAAASRHAEPRADAPRADAPRADVPASPANCQLRVIVQSKGRVEVSLELQGSNDAARLVATELRSLGAGTEPVRDIAISFTDGDAPALIIVVPDDQPAGVYNGLLLDRTSQRPCGTISLSIAGD